MLTKGDDYPIHQTALPIAYSGTDRNFYDRYFFNGYSKDGEYYFAAALGIYPNINIMDASFCLLKDGIQHNIHASRLLNMERMNTKVGPISVDIIEPLEKLAVRVDKNEYGITADLTFEARIKVIEEPRFTLRIGPRTLFDYTRLTQNGTWSGWIEIDGKQITITNDYFQGTRDRSWGVRPIGVQDPQPIVPASPPQFYWLWAPLNFDDCATFYAENAYPDGTPWVKSGIYSPLGDQEPIVAASSNAKLTFKSGTRHASNAEIEFTFENRADMKIRLEPRYNFYQSGLGYLNPEWGHAIYKGDDVVGYETYEIDKVDEKLPLYWHVQAFCNALMIKADGKEKRGAGILEQLIIGPHEPSGFKDILDMAP